jgi:hypothetical protein
MLQDWMLGHSTGRLQALLPLIFHPLTMIRRATAVFLAPILFLPPCQLADPSLPHPPPPAAPDLDLAVHPSPPISLYATFTSSHYLPIRSRPLELPPAESAPPQPNGGVVASLLGAQGQDKIHMVGLLLSLGKLVDVATLHAAASSSPLTGGEGEDTERGRYRCMQELLDHLPGAVLWSCCCACLFGLINFQVPHWHCNLHTHDASQSKHPADGSHVQSSTRCCVFVLAADTESNKYAEAVVQTTSTCHMNRRERLRPASTSTTPLPVLTPYGPRATQAATLTRWQEPSELCLRSAFPPTPLAQCMQPPKRYQHCWLRFHLRQ